MLKKILLGLIILNISLFAVQNYAQSATVPQGQTANTINTQFPHWKKNHITVYIPKDPTRAGAMKRAFLRWQNAASNKFSFEFIDNEDNADIKVSFSNQVDGSDGPIGSYNITTSGMEIKKGEITLATQTPNINKYTNNYIFTVMLHEIGHVLGLPDSTRRPSSIMNMPVTEKQDIIKTDIRKLYNINNWSYSDRRFND